MDDALRHVADAGYRRAVYFPYGFLADNAETELEGRIALRKQPRIEALQLPCLNDSPRLMSALATAIVSEARTSATLPRAS
jgi:protoheme ferro-lyase